MLSVTETKEDGASYDPSDRRHSVRHKLRGGPLAINPRILGPILDISMHGMSFEYSGEDLPCTQFMEIGIFVSESQTIIPGIQTRNVRDHISNTCSSFIPVIRKIRAVEFLDLTTEQYQQLQQIINTLSTDSP